MNEPIEAGDSAFERVPPFPVPRWARLTAFVGIYALVLVGAHAVQRSVEWLFELAGIGGNPLHGVGVLAGLYVGVMGLRGLLHDAAGSRDRALYRTACSLVAGVAALAVASIALVNLRLFAPDLATTGLGASIPPLAALATLALAWPITVVATRRRARMAETATDALIAEQAEDMAEEER